MFSLLIHLFCDRKREEEVPLPEPTPSPLVQKIADWVLNIKKEDMATQRNDGNGYEINLVESIDDKNETKKLILWEVNNDDPNTQRSIEIERIVKKDIFKERDTLYFLIELSKGEDELTFNEMFEDNINQDNRKTLRRVFFHILKLHDYSTQRIVLDKLKSEKEEKYKNFTENF
jgi:hypothetical protein